MTSSCSTRWSVKIWFELSTSRLRKLSNGYGTRRFTFTWIRPRSSYSSRKGTIPSTVHGRCAVRWSDSWRIRSLRSCCEATSNLAKPSKCMPKSTSWSSKRSNRNRVNQQLPLKNDVHDIQQLEKGPADRRPFYFVVGGPAP